MGTVLSRHSRSFQLENVSNARIILLALVLSLTCGLFVAQTSTLGAIVVAAALAAPVIAVIEGAPIFAFLTLYPLVWPWSFAGMGAEHVLGLFCLTAWAFGVLLRRQPIRLPSSLASYLILTFFFLSLLSIVTMTSAYSAYLFRIFALNSMLFVMAYSSSGTISDVVRNLHALVIGTTLAGLVALLGFLQGQSIQSQGLDRLGLEGVGVNHFASVLLLGSAVAIGLALGTHRSSKLSIFWLAGLLLTILVVLSQSRGAFLGQAVLVVVGVMFVNQSRRRFLMVVPMLFVLALIAIGPRYSDVLGDYSQRMLDLISAGEVLESARPYLWEMAFQGFVDHPLFGLGIGNFTMPINWFELAIKTSAPEFIHPLAAAHSFYLGALVELGLLGFIPLIGGVVLVGFGIVRIAWRSSIGRGSMLTGPAYAILFGYATYFAAITLLPAQRLAIPYILLGVADGFRRAVENNHDGESKVMTED